MVDVWPRVILLVLIVLIPGFILITLSATLADLNAKLSLALAKRLETHGDHYAVPKYQAFYARTRMTWIWIYRGLGGVLVIVALAKIIDTLR